MITTQTKKLRNVFTADLKLEILESEALNSDIPPKLRTRVQKFIKRLKEKTVYRAAIQKFAYYGLSGYSGAIRGLRPLIWMILLDYISLDKERWDAELGTKRKAYWTYVKEFLGKKKNFDVEKLKKVYRCSGVYQGKDYQDEPNYQQFIQVI